MDARVLVIIHGSYVSKVRWSNKDYEVYTKDLHTFRFVGAFYYASIDRKLLVREW